MSILTKVFVILLTVLAIALSMFVIAAFAQQENWRASAADWKAAALAAQAKERTITASAAIDQQRALDRHQSDGAKIEGLKDTVLEKNLEVAGLDRRVADLENKLAVKEGQLTSTNHLSNLIEESFRSEQQLSTKLSARNSELERRNIDLNDRVKELTASMVMARSQIRALKEQITSVADERVAAGQATRQIPGGPGVVQAYTPSVAPPPVVAAMTSPIRAEVTEVKGGLASISVGSTDGVAHGMTFLLYRAGGENGKPQYLGTLRITRVEANRSAGTVDQVEGEIRPGDQARDEASFALRR